MANRCNTSYVLTGPKEDLEEIRDTMNKIIGLENHGWVEDLIEALGTKEYGGRGDFYPPSEITETENGHEMSFFTDTAWNRMEYLESAISAKYPDIEILFIEEELGEEIFCTNDATGTHFQTVIIDFENEDMEYYTEKEALAKLSELKGSPVTNWEEAIAYADTVNEEQDRNNSNEHIWLHKAEII